MNRRSLLLALLISLVGLGLLATSLIVRADSNSAALAVAAQQEATATPAAEDTPEAETPEAEVPEAPAVAQPGGELPIDLEIALVKVADGLVDPVNVVAAPDGSGRLFVVERPGRVQIVQNGEVMDEPFLDISDQVLSAFLEQGLYDLEFHPNFAQNGRFFVHYAELLRNGDSMIVEYQVAAGDPNQADPESARAIMQIDQPWANHNGGELAFGQDGYLYIGSGDGGWEGDPLEAGQDLSTLLGKILRIDVDNGDPYAIPEDNPFVEDLQPVQLFGISEETFAAIHTEAAPEIWAYGLRNPWKFSFDPQTGDLYLPDVGQNHWEEINFQPADSTGGENYGWDFNMGSHCFPIEAESCPIVGVLPIAEYSHDLGLAVVGIGVYRGTQFADMDGIYFAGDWGSGRIWGLAQDEEGVWQMEELLETRLQLTGAGQDANGNLYVTSCNCNYQSGSPAANPPGSLWQIVPADQVPEDAEVASTNHISDTVTLELVVDGLTAPLVFQPVPDDSGRFLIVDQVGQIRVLDEEGVLLEQPFLDLSDQLVELQSGFDERGLLGLALHPDYAENGRFYVYYSAPLREEAPQDWNHTSHISEFTVSADDPNVADPTSERLLLQVDQPQFNHDGGQIAFGPDGYLYIPLGDGGQANDEGLGHVPDWYDVNAGGNGQDLATNLLGSILRIDVDDEGTEAQPYGIPEDNPFVDVSGAEEVWAYGFRNPFRISFDMGGENQLFVGDAGQNRWEEVSIVTAGGNYGWNVKEGTHCFSTLNADQDRPECPDTTPDGEPLIDPVIEYANGNQPGGLGLVVIGGYVYRGEAMPARVGSYIFADWSTSFANGDGRLFLATPSTDEDALWDMHELWIAGLNDGRIAEFILSFGQDEAGELYLLTSETTGPEGDTGKIYRIGPAPGVGAESSLDTVAAADRRFLLRSHVH